MAEIAPPLAPVNNRLMSIDAYRGLVMLAMVSHSLGLQQVSVKLPQSRFWSTLAFQFEHVPWVGCSFWDLIQPSFMFLVGTALAFSFAARRNRGDSFGRMALHAAVRAVALVLLGVFLRSNGAEQTNFTFVDVTTQIGLGYFFLFLLAGAKPWVQAVAATAVLVGYWLLLVLYPLPPADFDWASVNVPSDWRHFTGLSAHFSKHTNAAAAFDSWLLNLFPRPKPFTVNDGGYATLNFVPSLATMIFGLLAGELLRTSRSGWAKFGWLIAAGLAALGIGLALHEAGVCPIVKRIWTPSWAIYSTGWVLLILGGFFAFIELARLRTWAFPFIVVGMNSIAIYCLDKLTRGWILQTIRTHLGENVFTLFGDTYAPLVECVVAMTALWLICWWMYRRRLFLKL